MTDLSNAAPASPLVTPSAMPRAGATSRSALHRALAEISAAHPTARKRFIAPDVNFARECLLALARSTGGWIGWEAATLRTIADELAFVPLAERELRIGGDVEIRALIDRALDATIERGRVSSRFAALGASLGFRRALTDAVLELRTAGVGFDAVRRGAAPGSPAEGLSEVLREYEALLAAERLADPSAVFRAAIEAFDTEAPYVLDGLLLLAPTIVARGLPGELVERLIGHGARVLSVEPMIGADVPSSMPAARAGSAWSAGTGAVQPASRTASPLAWLAAAELPRPDDERLDPGAVSLDVFAGATPSDELREVCRRIIAEGLRWDEVEIAATDRDTYGVALDALCQQLDVRATMLHGVPLARTRLGRALDRWLRWLEEGLPADVLRQSLEAGELRVADAGLPPSALARELRAQSIGWGRARYESALDALGEGRDRAPSRREGETDEEYEARRAARRRGGDALAALLRSLLAITPPVQERGSTDTVRASVTSLARATLGWLELVPRHGMAEEQTAARLSSRLEALAGLAPDETTFAGALAALREELADLRAWPLVSDERKPWSAAGGMLHLTDIAHAGCTGRPRIFVVGLDADRTLGGVQQDPLLPDSTRRAIASGALGTSVTRRRESEVVLLNALASLRGRVTLSHATSGTLDGREAGPSAVMLQAWRIARGDATLSFAELREALRPPASAVPHANSALLDARDVWLDAIADGPLLLDASSIVRRAFPGLDAGLRAVTMLSVADATAHHGIVPAAADVLASSFDGGREISPSALETLARCPLSWFYKYGLSLRPPDDPEYDPDAWLDALERGSLLHELFERFGAAYRDRQAELRDDAARDRLLALLDEIIDEWRRDVPPPSVAIFEAERNELRASALAFLEMERELASSRDGGRWTHFELRFGGDAPAGRYELGDGRALAVRGSADRVDAMPDGTLRVVDYKTGLASPYVRSSKSAPFRGGRQLQPAIYAEAIGRLLGARVSRFEYRFPTQRGQNEIVRYDAVELEQARPIIAGLLAHIHDGAFVPTTDAADCAWCEHQLICRADRTSATSPRAEWAGANAPTLPVYATMLARRVREETTR